MAREGVPTQGLLHVLHVLSLGRFVLELDEGHRHWGEVLLRESTQNVEDRRVATCLGQNQSEEASL